MKTARDILHEHLKAVTTPENNRAPLDTQLTLVCQSALLAMEEYASQFKASQGSSEEQKPHGFCVTPGSNCTLNYCDDNGCQDRKRTLTEPQEEQKPDFEVKTDLEKHLAITLRLVQKERDALQSRIRELEAENEELRKKGQKWDDLHRKIGRFYEEEVDGDLVDIGEVAAHAFGFL